LDGMIWEEVSPEAIRIQTIENNMLKAPTEDQGIASQRPSGGIGEILRRRGHTVNRSCELSDLELCDTILGAGVKDIWSLEKQSTTFLHLHQTRRDGRRGAFHLEGMTF
jgi:hypothetical protein